MVKAKTMSINTANLGFLEEKYGEHGRRLAEKFGPQDSDEPFVCESCGRAFESSDERMMFGGAHPGAKIFSWCKVCGQANSLLLISSLPSQDQQDTLGQLMDITKFHVVFSHFPAWDSDHYTFDDGDDLIDFFVTSAQGRLRMEEYATQMAIRDLFTEMHGFGGMENLMA